MARNINLIGCTNVRVDPDVEDFIAIDCQDMEFDSSYSGKTVLKNGAITITDEGIITDAPIVDSIDEVADFATSRLYGIYYCDTTAGIIDVDLIAEGRPYTFIKTAGANALNLNPATGNINGGASYTVTTPVTVYFDGTNWHVK